MLVGAHLQPHDLGTVDVDDHALDGRHDRVAGQGVFPGLQDGMADPGLDQVHLPHSALVLLEGGDLLRIGRPQQDRAVAAGPAGVVGGVAEVLDAVGRQGLLRACPRLLQPEVVVLDEGRPLAVGRDRGRGAEAGARAHRRCRGGGGRFILPANAGLRLVGPALAVDREEDRAAVGRDVDGRERKRVGLIGLPGGFGQRGRKLDGIESGRLALLGRVDEDEVGRIGGRRDTVPEALSREPSRAHARPQDERRQRGGGHSLGLGVVGGREGGRPPRRLRLQGQGGQQDEKQRENGPKRALVHGRPPKGHHKPVSRKGSASWTRREAYSSAREHVKALLAACLGIRAGVMIRACGEAHFTHETERPEA